MPKAGPLQPTNICLNIRQIHFQIYTNTFQKLEKYIYTRETLGQQADAEGRPTATDKDYTNTFPNLDKYI